MEHNEGIKRLATRVEAAYEVPAGVQWPDVEEAVLVPFGSTIDPAFTETIDGTLWVVTAGEPSEIDKVDVAYREWRRRLGQSAE